MEILIQYLNSFAFLIFFTVGYVAGSYNEKQHYKSIKAREKDLVKLPALTLRAGFEKDQATGAKLVMGNAVISVDYFKRVLAALRNLTGGRVTTYETLVDRARREAILRMKESATGAKLIANVRVETSAIGRSANNRRAVGSVEAIAYGTAVFAS